MHSALHSSRKVSQARKRLGQLLSVAVLFSLPGVALADDAEGNYARSGWYLGAGGVGASFRGAESQLESAFSVANADVDNSLGFNLSAGYRGHEHLAVEVAFELMDDTDVDLSGGETSSIDSWSLMAYTKPYLMTGQIQPFVLAGLGIMQVRVSDPPGLSIDGPSATEFAVRFGGGVDFYATEHVVIAVGANYVLPTGDIKDFDYLAIEWGLKYRF